MAEDKVTIRLPPALRDAAEEQVDRGGYMDLSEYVREAVREKTPEARVRERQRERAEEWAEE